MSVLRSGFLERRRAAAIVFALFVAGGIVFVFAGALTRATELEQEAARARAEVAALEERLAAGNAEVEFIRSDHFVEQQARVVGYGERGEQPFRLPMGHPRRSPSCHSATARRQSCPAPRWKPGSNCSSAPSPPRSRDPGRGPR